MKINRDRLAWFLKNIRVDNQGQELTCQLYGG
jgi:hypothetical protein